MRTKKIVGRAGAAAAAVLLLAVCALPAAAQDELARRGSYIYTQDGKDVPIPDVYTSDGSVALRDRDGTAANEPQDMSLFPDGTFVVADTGNSRLLLVSPDGTQTALTALSLPDGTSTSLSQPEGVTVCDDGAMLVADTDNGRILRLDRTGAVLREYPRPANMLGLGEDDAYLPTKVDEDGYGRLYIVARNVNRGILCLDPDGVFVGYIGAPRVMPDLIELLWRRVSTKAQLAQMTQYVSTEYDNLCVDDKNFVWGTIGALDAADIKAAVAGHDLSGQVTPVTRINAGDSDVLHRTGSYAPLGDLRFEKEQSVIVDIALGTGGTYSLLDRQRGRVFTYDSNGELLFAFGGMGDQRGGLHAPTALLYDGDRLCILDRTSGTIERYRPTAHGSLILQAVTAQYTGDLTQSYALWSEVARQSSNFEYAFIGMGRVCMNEKDYTQAMAYFRYANDTSGYSEAFEQLRKQRLSVAFPYIFWTLAAGAVVLIAAKLVRRIVRYIRGEED